MFPPSRSPPRHLLPSSGSGRTPFPCFAGTMRCSDSRRSSRRASFPSLGGTIPCVCLRPPLQPDAGREAWGFRDWHPPRQLERMETSGVPRFLENPDMLLPCSSTPAGPTHQALTMHRRGPRSRNDRGSQRKVISGLNRTASALAVYASSRPVTRPRRKTRFRVLAKLSRAGLITRRIPTRGFDGASYIIPSSPRLRLAQSASPFSFF